MAMLKTTKEEFEYIYNEYIKRPGAERLLKWLESSGFFEAPASARHHLARPGGLAEHSINVWRRLVEIASNELWKKQEDETPEITETEAILGLLHDICKVDVYHKGGGIEAVENGRIKELYRFRDPLPLGHGEKSLFLITRFMPLTQKEALAIRWHMGAYDSAVKGGSKDLAEAMKITPWVWWLHEADMCATWMDEGGAAE